MLLFLNGGNKLPRRSFAREVPTIDHIQTFPPVCELLRPREKRSPSGCGNDAIAASCVGWPAQCIALQTQALETDSDVVALPQSDSCPADQSMQVATSRADAGGAARPSTPPCKANRGLIVETTTSIRAGVKSRSSCAGLGICRQLRDQVCPLRARTSCLQVDEQSRHPPQRSKMTGV
jgi:hypothetical protein